MAHRGHGKSNSYEYWAADHYAGLPAVAQSAVSGGLLIGLNGNKEYLR